MPYSIGAINPQTGVPFKDEAEWKQWDSDQQSKGAKTAATAINVASSGATSAGDYNWGGVSNSYTDPYSGNIYLGDIQGAGGIEGYQGPSNYELPWQGTGGDWNYGKANSQSAYIDPHTGKLTYMYSTGAPDSANQSGSLNASRTIDVDPYRDYGLGAGNEGIIVTGRSATGAPVKFYVDDVIWEK